MYNKLGNDIKSLTVLHVDSVFSQGRYLHWGMYISDLISLKCGGGGGGRRF